MVYRKAVCNDIPELIRLRILFQNEVRGISAPPLDYDRDLQEYLSKSLNDGSFIAWLAEEDGRIVATSGMCFSQIMPGYSNQTGRTAYIQNMYTVPGWRRRGLASALFERLINEAKSQNIRRISLHATADGRKVYEKFGFLTDGGEMSLSISNYK